MDRSKLLIETASTSSTGSATGKLTASKIFVPPMPFSSQTYRAESYPTSSLFLFFFSGRPQKKVNRLLILITEDRLIDKRNGIQEQSLEVYKIDVTTGMD